MWVLIVIMAANNPVPAVIPGTYSTKERCEQAAAAFVDALPILQYGKGLCIPAPDDLYDTQE